MISFSGWRAVREEEEEEREREAPFLLSFGCLFRRRPMSFESFTISESQEEALSFPRDEEGKEMNG